MHRHLEPGSLFVKPTVKEILITNIGERFDNKGYDNSYIDNSQYMICRLNLNNTQYFSFSGIQILNTELVLFSSTDNHK